MYEPFPGSISCDGLCNINEFCVGLIKGSHILANQAKCPNRPLSPSPVCTWIFSFHELHMKSQEQVSASCYQQLMLVSIKFAAWKYELMMI